MIFTGRRYGLEVPLSAPDTLQIYSEYVGRLEGTSVIPEVIRRAQSLKLQSAKLYLLIIILLLLGAAVTAQLSNLIRINMLRLVRGSYTYSSHRLPNYLSNTIHQNVVSSICAPYPYVATRGIHYQLPHETDTSLDNVMLRELGERAPSWQATTKNR